MKPFNRLTLVYLAALALASCTPGRVPVATETAPSPTAEIRSSPEVQTSAPAATESLPVATPTRARPPEPLSRYSLSATLDYDAHQATVQETISYVNHTGEELSELVLVVEPNRYLGGFILDSLTGKDEIALAGYTLEGVQLRVPLPAGLPPGQSVDLILAYRLLLPNQNAPYGWTERQVNLGDWYPYIPPYRPGEGWLVRDDGPQGEHLAYDPADFQVEMRLARPQDASGRSLVVAASALPQTEGEGYRYRLGAARNFALSISPLYQVQQAAAGPVTVTGYAFPGHPSADQPALQEAAKALQVFGDLFGPYPHDSLSVVEADFLDGMEYDGLIFLSHAFYDFYTGDARNNLTIIAAHEVAHQWWYGLVGNDQALEPWLDEALCTYSELLFYEAVYPDLAGWWRENRIDFHNPQGWVDATIYDYPDFYPYRNAVYLRGALFLVELRTRMGDEAFKAFLRDYLNRFAYRQATTADFFAVLSEHTSEDLSGLVSAYFANQ
ncbi:MAG TPA: M1 family metallopeptidase [Anaerolineales bacterium]|nr:M1 family metallopeptidase [Anaerolineales bacterium]